MALKILYFCQHKTAKWEGFVYENDQGRSYVTNGLAVWELNDKRQEALELVACIDLMKIRERAEKCCPYDDVLKMLSAPGKAVEVLL